MYRAVNVLELLYLEKPKICIWFLNFLVLTWKKGGQAPSLRHILVLYIHFVMREISEREGEWEMRES